MCAVKELEVKQPVFAERPSNILPTHISATCEASVANIGSYSLSSTMYAGCRLEAFAIKLIGLLTLFNQNRSSSVRSRIKTLPHFFKADLGKTTRHGSVGVTQLCDLIKEMIIKIHSGTCNSRTPSDQRGFFVPSVAPQPPTPRSWLMYGLELAHHKPQAVN